MNFNIMHSNSLLLWVFVVVVVVVMLYPWWKEINSLEDFIFISFKFPNRNACCRHAFVVVVVIVVDTILCKLFLNASICIVYAASAERLMLRYHGRRHFTTYWQIAIAVNPSRNCIVRRWHRAHVRIVCLSIHSFLHASIVRRHAFPTFDFRFRHTIALLRLHLWQISLDSSTNHDVWFVSFLWDSILDFHPYRDTDTLLKKVK